MLDRGFHSAVAALEGGTVRTVAYCEREAYAIEVLASRMEDKALDQAPIFTDLTAFPARRFAGKVAGVVAGFPCQPFSVAGKREGDEDERFLWEDILRIFVESESSILAIENVPGLRSTEYNEYFIQCIHCGNYRRRGMYWDLSEELREGRKILRGEDHHRNGGQFSSDGEQNDGSLRRTRERPPKIDGVLQHGCLRDNGGEVRKSDPGHPSIPEDQKSTSHTGDEIERSVDGSSSTWESATLEQASTRSGKISARTDSDSQQEGSKDFSDGCNLCSCGEPLDEDRKELVRGTILGRILDDLSEIGCISQWGHFRASAVGANHRRERVFLLAYRNVNGRSPWWTGLSASAEGQGERTAANFELRCDSVSTRSVEHSKCSERRSIDPTGNDIQCNGQDAGEKREEGATGTLASGGIVSSGAVGNAASIGLQGQRSVGRQGPAISVGSSVSGCAGDRLPVFAPARNDYRGWIRVLSIDPTLVPAIRRPDRSGIQGDTQDTESEVRLLPDGMASALEFRTDRIRLTGNGVVEQQAASAYYQLFQRLFLLINSRET